MAFGKNDSNLGNVGGFRNQARQYDQKRARPAGNFGGAQFRDKYQPSTDDPDEIRIIRGNYEVDLGQADGTLVKQQLSYFPYIEHFHATMKKGSICSAGPFGNFKNKGEPCRGCEQFWGDKNAGRKNGPMSKRELWGFTVLHYATYAKVPQIDRQTGQARTNDQGVPYTEWAHVLPHKRHEFKDVEMRDHHVMHWSIGFGHSEVLRDYDKEIGKSCVSCGGRDTIVCEAWTCSNCGEALIEPATTHLSPKEVDKLTAEPVRCGSCHAEELMNEIISCSKCPNAKRADIFDVDMRLKRVKSEERNSNQTKLIITGWSDPRPIDQRYTEIAKPLALDKIFQPTPYQKQEEMYGQGNRAPVDPNQLSRPYGGHAPTLGGPQGNQGGGNGPTY